MSRTSSEHHKFNPSQLDAVNMAQVNFSRMTHHAGLQNKLSKIMQEDAFKDI